MYSALSPGAIGVTAPDLETAIAAAKVGGFQGVEFSGREIADRIKKDGIASLRALFHDSGIRPAGWGLPVDWRGDQEKFQTDLALLPEIADAAASIGCTRTCTWILPMSDDRPYDENRQFHLDRLGQVAQVLNRHECRFGLEFIGPKTMRDQGRHPFIYKMSDMLQLASEMGPNVGLLLDSWHCFTSHGTLDDLRALTNDQIVYVHLNDAPKGIEIDDQIDSVRCLPGETGVIPLRYFLSALDRLGYDGPVVPEPFKASLNDLPSDKDRLKAVGQSMANVWNWA
jgi:sugar phosphate isomerase/epimerase